MHESELQSISLMKLMTRSNEIQNESDDHDSAQYRPQCQTIDCTRVLLLVSDSANTSGT